MNKKDIRELRIDYRLEKKTVAEDFAMLLLKKVGRPVVVNIEAKGNIKNA